MWGLPYVCLLGFDGKECGGKLAGRRESFLEGMNGMLVLDWSGVPCGTWTPRLFRGERRVAFLWPSLTHAFPVGLCEAHTRHLGLIRAVKCFMELDTHTSKRAHAQHSHSEHAYAQHSHSDTHAGLHATCTHRRGCTQLPTLNTASRAILGLEPPQTHPAHGLCRLPSLRHSRSLKFPPW